MRRSHLWSLALLVGAGCGSDEAVPSLPVADAGFNRTVQADIEARLDGTRSYDPEQRPLNYAWTVVSRPAGSRAELQAATTAEPVITPDAGGSYLFSLVVNNGLRDSRPATVALLVIGGTQNVAPMASAECLPADCRLQHGTTTPTTSGTTFRLDGRDSFDPNGEALSFRWTQLTSAAECGLCPTSGFVCTPTVTTLATFPSASFGATAALAELQAPMAVGTMVFSLAVTDARGLASATCVGVESTNNPPLAIIVTPSPTTVSEGAAIVLDGGASGDQDAVDAAQVTYLWTHAPAELTVTYTPNAASRNVTATVSGLSGDTEVVFTLTVADPFTTSDPCALSTAVCGRTCCGEVAVQLLDL